MCTGASMSCAAEVATKQIAIVPARHTLFHFNNIQNSLLVFHLAAGWTELSIREGSSELPTPLEEKSYAKTSRLTIAVGAGAAAPSAEAKKKGPHSGE